MMHAINNSSSSDQNFYLDSGATRHLAGSRSVLHNIRTLSSPINISLADGRTISVMEEGELHLNTPYGRRSLSNVALYEGAGTNLISVGALTDKGAVGTFTSDGGKVVDAKGRVLFDGDRVGRSLYSIRCSVLFPSSPSAPFQAVERIQLLNDDDLSLWH
jgi:hypothetical protein